MGRRRTSTQYRRYHSGAPWLRLSRVSTRASVAMARWCHSRQTGGGPDPLRPGDSGQLAGRCRRSSVALGGSTTRGRSMDLGDSAIGSFIRRTARNRKGTAGHGVGHRSESLGQHWPGDRTTHPIVVGSDRTLQLLFWRTNGSNRHGRTPLDLASKPEGMSHPIPGLGACSRGLMG